MKCEVSVGVVDSVALLHPLENIEQEKTVGLEVKQSSPIVQGKAKSRDSKLSVKNKYIKSNSVAINQEDSSNTTKLTDSKSSTKFNKASKLPASDRSAVTKQVLIFCVCLFVFLMKVPGSKSCTNSTSSY